jgi:hypothetical protein
LDGILHVQGVPHSDAPHLVAALVAAGIGIYQVLQEQGTLEDVYFALQEPLEENKSFGMNAPESAAP